MTEDEREIAEEKFLDRLRRHRADGWNDLVRRSRRYARRMQRPPRDVWRQRTKTMRRLRQENGARDDVAA